MTANRKRPRDAWIADLLSADCDLPPAVRLVAVGLAQYMNFDTLDNAFPGTARLAVETGLHGRTVQRHLGLLVDEGWVEQTSKGGTAVSGKQFASTYRGIPRHSATHPTASDPAPHGTPSQTPRRDATPTSHDPVKDRGHDHAAAPGGAGAARARRTGHRSNVSAFPAGIGGVYARGADRGLVKRTEVTE